MKAFNTVPGGALALALSLGLAAQPLLAQQAMPEDIEALSRAIAAAGCTVSMQNQQTVAAEAGLENAVAASAARHLFETGQATVAEGGTLRLLTGPCADAGAAPEAPALLVAVIGALRGNACSMTQRQGDALLGPLGERDAVRAQVQALRDSGLASVTEDDNRILVLSEPLCVADEAQVQVLAANVAAVAAIGGEDFATSRMGASHALLGAIRAAGCVFDEPEALAVLSNAGIEEPGALLHSLEVLELLFAYEGFVDLEKITCKVSDADLPGLLIDAFGSVEG